MLTHFSLRTMRYFFVDTASAIRKEKQIKLVSKLQNNLTPTYLHVKDTTLGAHSCGLMYKIVIESPAFAQKSKLQQHKMVMDALSQEMDQIHALNVKTRTPSQLNILSLNKDEALEQEQIEEKKII